MSILSRPCGRGLYLSFGSLVTGQKTPLYLLKKVQKRKISLEIWSTKVSFGASLDRYSLYNNFVNCFSWMYIYMLILLWQTNKALSAYAITCLKLSFRFLKFFPFLFVYSWCFLFLSFVFPSKVFAKTISSYLVVGSTFSSANHDKSHLQNKIIWNSVHPGTTQRH